MDIIREIKPLVYQEGYTMKKIYLEMNARYNLKLTSQSFSNKLNQGHLKYSEAKMIAEILGYEIVWVKKEKE